MKQFAIIGLGTFGYYLATRLYEKGHDILAMDKDPTLVQKIKDSVSQAVVADAADPRTVESLFIKEMDAAVVCIGTDISASILVTLNLKDIGIQKIYAKAITDSHGRILRKVGADEILFPERDLAVSLAEKLHNPSVLDYLPFLEGYSIIELSPPKGFPGKELKALDLINRYGVQVLAVKKAVSGQFKMIPTGTYVLKDDEALILLGPNDALDSIRKKEE
jgi:trk system potassium uptake protein TrkA